MYASTSNNAKPPTNASIGNPPPDGDSGCSATGVGGGIFVGICATATDVVGIGVTVGVVTVEVGAIIVVAVNVGATVVAEGTSVADAGMEVALGETGIFVGTLVLVGKAVALGGITVSVEVGVNVNVGVKVGV